MSVPGEHLCSNCNVGIGFLQDSVTVMAKAIDYLNRTSTYAKG